MIEVTNPRCLRCGTVDGVRDRLEGKKQGHNLLLCDACDKFCEENPTELSVMLAENYGIKVPHWVHGLICGTASVVAHVNDIFWVAPRVLHLAKQLLKFPVLHLARWMMLTGVDLLLWCAPKDRSGLKVVVAGMEQAIKVIKEFTNETA